MEGLGVVALGRDLVSLDAVLCNLAGFDLHSCGAHIDTAEEEGLGIYDRQALTESKMKVGNWLSPEPYL